MGGTLMLKTFALKRSLIFAAAFMFVAALLVTPAIARTTVQMQDSTVTINGKVKAVSASSLTVVDDQKAEQTIGLDANTKITKGGKEATATDIKADDSVMVVASKGEGAALTAISIKVG
jgi:type 1 fimbria pilin